MKGFIRFLWLTLLIVMLSAIALGAKRGEWRRIKTNAENLCTACIGLGK